MKLYTAQDLKNNNNKDDHKNRNFDITEHAVYLGEKKMCLLSYYIKITRYYIIFFNALYFVFATAHENFFAKDGMCLMWQIYLKIEKCTLKF